MKRIAAFLAGIVAAIAFTAFSQTTIAPGGAIFDQANGSWVGFVNRSTGAEERIRNTIYATGASASQLRTSQTTVPTCSASCGTSPTVVGTDTAMLVTMGASGVPASGWVVTFNGTWASAPVCTASMALGTMAIGKLPMVLVTTATNVTVTTNGVAPATSDKYFVQCLGVS